MIASQAAPRIAVPPVIDAAVLASLDIAAPIVRLDGATMGTTWRVHAVVPSQLRVDAGDLAVRIDARLAAITRQMSHWEPGSMLSLFNQASAGSVFALPQDFAAVIASGLQIAEASGGAFDPAIGRLTDLWGLGPHPAASHPTTTAMAKALRHTGWQRLQYDRQAKALTQPGGVWLDLSGIAKGYAVDAIAELLAAMGVTHALVEIGGECRGRGMRPDGDPWWVDIENPPACKLPPLRVALHRLALATSGDYLNGAHTLNPATGQPVSHATTAVSVLHASCMVADAWATALGVTEPERARHLARDHGLAARIVLRTGEEWLSPALQVML